MSSHIRRSAEISDCGRYRWWLRRTWPHHGFFGESPSRGCVCFVMLNPSTADGMQDDPTTRRCIGFAKRWGFNTICIRNLFPWIATDPRELRRAEDVTGGHRGDIELMTSLTGDMVVAAWGTGVPLGRDHHVMEMFRKAFPLVQVHCLGTTKNGSPRHPLYVRAETDPIVYCGGIKKGSEE